MENVHINNKLCQCGKVLTSNKYLIDGKLLCEECHQTLLEDFIEKYPPNSPYCPKGMSNL